jgi:antitoxin component of RelBE/YafQ-DinJ toxin-antitoxin module
MRSQTKPETKNTSLVILRLPDELKTKAQEVAAESGATLSELIRSLLKKKIGK